MRNAASVPALALAVLLAACGTPQEQCIARATRELATVDKLIAETEANLRRGYAYETREITRSEWQICEWIEPPPPADPDAPKPRPRPRYCLEEVTDTVQRPVAIDPAAETRKLKALTARRKELARTAAVEVDRCKAQYPE